MLNEIKKGRGNSCSWIAIIKWIYCEGEEVLPTIQEEQNGIPEIVTYSPSSLRGFAVGEAVAISYL